MTMAAEYELEAGLIREKGKRIGRLELMLRALTGEAGLVFATEDILEQNILTVADYVLTQEEQVWYTKLGVFVYRTDLKDYGQLQEP